MHIDETCAFMTLSLFRRDLGIHHTNTKQGICSVGIEFERQREKERVGESGTCAFFTYIVTLYLVPYLHVNESEPIHEVSFCFKPFAYEVATNNRLPKSTGLFCNRAL